MRLSLLVAVAGCARAPSAPPLPPLDLRTFPDELLAEAGPVAKAYTASPDDACVLYRVAELHARAGHRSEAIATLRRMAALGTGVHPRIRDFGPLADDLLFGVTANAIQK